MNNGDCFNVAFVAFVYNPPSVSEDGGSTTTCLPTAEYTEEVQFCLWFDQVKLLQAGVNMYV